MQSVPVFCARKGQIVAAMILRYAVLIGIFSLSSCQSTPKFTCYSGKCCRGNEVNLTSAHAGQSECCMAGGRGLSFTTTINGTCQECYNNKTFMAQGSKFFLGIFANPSRLPFFRIGKFRLAVSPVHSSQVDFIVNASGVATDYTAPIEVSMDAATVSIDNDGVRDRAIVIESTNNDSLSVVAYAEEFTSSDTFKLLPCVNLPVRVYEYYAVSVPLAQVPVDRVEDDYESDEKFEAPQGNSTIVIVTSEQSTQVNITLTQNVPITAPDLLQQIPGGKFEAGVPATVLLPSKAQTLLIYSLNDLTGSRITSNKPIFLISGHQCGTVPENVNFCDHMVEQIPPTATWGKTFVTSAIANRTSFDIFKAIASQSNTDINISCINGQGQNFQQIQLQQSGQFENINVSSGSACYITSTCPILLVQFSVASTLDKPSTFRGDPFMVVVPPVEQYRTSYIIDTLQATAIPGVTSNAIHYINVIVPEGVDHEGLRLNGTVLEAPFMSIPCNSNTRNGPSCGMAAQIQVPIGRHNLTHMSGAIFNGISYTLSFRAGAGYPAGMAQKPVALPRLSFTRDEFQVFENQSLMLEIVRGGDLSASGSCSAYTLQLSSPNAALVGEDYIAMDLSIEFASEQREIVVEVPLINDVFPEELEKFEVHLSACPGVFVDSPSCATIEILNDDPDLPVMNISFVDVSIEVTEGECMVSFMLEKTDGAIEPVSVQIATTDGTAKGGDDFISINETVTFAVEDLLQPVVTFVIDNRAVEDMEQFTASISPIPGLFPVAVKNSTATVTIIDNDGAVFGFSQSEYSTSEERREVMITVELQEGVLESDVQILLLSSDGTARSGLDYLDLMMVLNFSAIDSSRSTSLVVIDDGIVERNEFVTCELRVILPSPRLSIPRSTTNVSIVDSDAAVIGLRVENTNGIVREGAGNARVLVNVVQGNLSEPVTIRLISVNLNAKSGEDFVAINRTIPIVDSVGTEVLIPVIEDTMYEGAVNEEFRVLAYVEGGGFEDRVTLQQNFVDIAIEDNDPRPEPLFRFNENMYTVSEGAGQVMLLVKISRDEGRLESASAQYFFIRGGTADEGTDMTVGTGTLMFPPGSEYAPVSIPIINDPLVERDEFFIVGLRSLQNETATTENSTAQVIIIDNDVVQIGFVATAFNTTEGGQVTLRVRRFNQTEETLRMSFRTEGLTAIEMIDFIPITMTLELAPNITDQEVTVRTLPDGIREVGSGEAFLARLTALNNPVQVNIVESVATIIIVSDIDRLPTSPENLQCQPAPTTLRCSWSQPTSGNVINYLLSWRYRGPCEETSQSFLLSPEARNRLLQGLEEGGDYEVSIFAVNQVGQGPIASIRVSTPATAPSAAPQSVRGTVSDRDVSLRWSPVNCLDQNGNIEQYTVRYRTMGGLETVTNVTSTMYTITGLTFGQQYSIEVAAANSEGLGAFSQPLIITLGQPPTINMVGFEQSVYEVFENSMFVSVSVILTGRTNQQIQVMLNTRDGTAVSGDDGADFSATLRSLTFMPSANDRQIITVPILITDDDVFENSETFSVVLNASDSGVMLGPNREATVTILDNEVIGIDFIAPRLRVSEDEGLIRLGVGITNASLGRPIVLSLQTSDITALSGFDYAPIATSLTLDGNSEAFFVAIRIIDEDLHEPNETFMIQLSTTDTSPGIVLLRSTINITIINDDVISFSFRQPEYVVMENVGEVIVNVDKSGRTSETITLLVEGRILPSNATPELGNSGLLTFLPDVVTEEIRLSVSNDMFAMEPPIITILNMTVQESVGEVALRPYNETTIQVIDDDVIELSFITPNMSVKEDAGSISVCFMGNTSSARTYTVVLMHQPTGSNPATFGSDYNIRTSDLTVRVPAGEPRRVCVPITIIADTVREQDETFVLGFQTLPMGVVSGAAAEVFFTITNVGPVNRIGFDPVTYAVDEDAGQVTVIVRILAGSFSSPVLLFVRSLDGTAVAGSDYTAVSQPLLFFPGVQSMIVNVLITADEIQEPSETFSLSLQAEDIPGSISPDIATITIRDVAPVTTTEPPATTPQPVVIGFGQSLYNVSERDRSVTVQVVLTGGTNRPVTVRITSRDGTAVSGGSEPDYEPILMDLEFQPSDSEQQTETVTIPIIDDEILENSEEELSLVLSSTDTSVIFSPEETSIVIVDDDGIQLGFQLRAYQESENSTTGRVSVTIEVIEGSLRRPVVVTMQTSDVTAVASRDYEPSTISLTFGTTSVSKVVSISIVDDTIHEGTETFMISLSTTASTAKVLLAPQSTLVNILDNDVISFSFRQSEYVVLESIGRILAHVDKTGRTSQNITLQISGRFLPVNTLSFSAEQVTNELDLRLSGIDDAIAMERNETIEWTLMTNTAGVSLTPNNVTLVQIIDDDVIELSFITPNVSVREDAESTEVCFMGNTSSAQTYTVVLMHQPTGSNPATFVTDYNIRVADLTVRVAAGDPRRECVPITIVNDALLMEQNETFVVQFQTLPMGVVQREPSEALVTIVNSGPCMNGDLRLQDESGRSNVRRGRVEICMNGVWGSICDTTWDGDDATVVCRQLGFSDQGAEALFRFDIPAGPEDSPIYLDDVMCAGTELRLEDCTSDTVTGDCTHFTQDAGVACQQ